MKHIIKLIGITAFAAVIIFGMAACDNGNGDDGGGSAATGLYMGIIGFNNSLTEKNISLLSNSTKPQYNSFINNLEMESATGLYYAVDNAINRLQAATLPNDVISVSLITFTDGLDNVSIDLNSSYNSRNEFRDAVSNRISTVRIKNLPINAYSIGMRGGDVVDIPAFIDGLTALASTPSNMYEATNMADVNETFSEIANSLYNESQSQSIRLRITSGYDDGTLIRFTFDNVDDTTVSSSNLYIEGTYRRSGSSRSLQDVVYSGLNSSSGSAINGTISGTYVTFAFENVTTTSGGSVSTDVTQQWEYIPSQSRWQRNSEFGQTGDTETTIDRKSAVIMLVLDCTTSLVAGGADGFNQMKSAANNFIDVLLSGSGGTGTGGNGTESNPIPLTAGTWAHGSVPNTTSEVWYSIPTTSGSTYYFWWNDSYEGNGQKTADISVRFTFTNGNVSEPYDSAWDTPYYITASQSGTIKIRVRPYGGYSTSTGTFAIVYSTNSTRPAYY